MSKLPDEVLEKMGRKTVTDAYIRVCRDSGFSLPFDRAAALVGKMLNITPLEVWLAVGTIETMKRVASGEHPATRAALSKLGGQHG